MLKSAGLILLVVTPTIAVAQGRGYYSNYSQSYNYCYPQSYNYYNPYTPYYIERVREVYVPVSTPAFVFVDPQFSYQYLGGTVVTLGGQQIGAGGVASQSVINNQTQPVSTATQPVSTPTATPTPTNLGQTQIGSMTVDQLLETLDKRAIEQRNTRPFAPVNGPPAIPSNSAVSANSSTSSQSIFAILSRNCSECHTGATAKMKFRIFDLINENGGIKFAKGVESPTIMNLIVDAIIEGRMPPPDCKTCTRLSNADKELLKKGV